MIYIIFYAWFKSKKKIEDENQQTSSQRVQQGTWFEQKNN